MIRTLYKIEPFHINLFRQRKIKKGPMLSCLISARAREACRSHILTSETNLKTKRHCWLVTSFYTRQSGSSDYHQKQGETLRRDGSCGRLGKNLTSSGNNGKSAFFCCLRLLRQKTDINIFLSPYIHYRYENRPKILTACTRVSGKNAA